MASDVAQYLEPVVRHAAQTAAAVHEHAAEASHSDIPELPNFVTLLSERWPAHPVVAFLHHWENLVFALVVALALCWAAWRYARKPAAIPRGRQNFIELLVESLDQFVQSVLGPSGRRHVPFIGTLFLYIWFMNLSVLIPGLKSPTSSLNTTIGLASVVFCYVQWIGISSNGLLTYLDHLAGSPRGVVGWCLVPLMLPLHVLGEFIKPLSLSLRLGFNVFAEDALLGVLVGLGLAASTALRLPVGLPLQLFVVPLVLIFSTVQALVFSLLSTVYIALMSPHGEHHEARHEPHTT